MTRPVEDFDPHPDEDRVRVFVAEPGSVLRFSDEVFVSAVRYGDVVIPPAQVPLLSTDRRRTFH